MNSNVVVDAALNIPYAKNRFNEDLELIDEISAEAAKVTIYSSRAQSKRIVDAITD